MIKSKLKPTRVQEYLGMIIDTVRNCFTASDERKQRVVALIQQLLDNPRHCSVHAMQVVAGNLISMHWSFGKLARLMTMSIYYDINSVSKGDSYVALSETTMHDLKFWLCCFDVYNGYRPIWSPPGFHMTFYTDAAGINLQNFGGWAGWTKDSTTNKTMIARGVWDENLTVEHSTLQELLAIFNVLKSFNRFNELKGKRILIKTDNEGVTYIINRGGSRDDVTHDICKDLLWYCVQSNIDIFATWIPRDKNQLADFYSKNTDSGDYMLNPTVFQSINKACGPFEVDLFASYDNNQLDKFFSLYFCPNALAINAFSVDWSTLGRCWCNPPWAMISRVWEHARASKANMCLLIPFTPTAPWWHHIAPDGKLFSPFVKKYQVLVPRPDLFKSGSSGYKCTGRTPRWHSLVLMIDFHHKKDNRNRIRLPNINV